MPKPPYVYVASSWRNPHFELTVDKFRSDGINCYDFKRDEGAQFHWSEVGVNSDEERFNVFVGALYHPRTIAGFASDFNAMKDASAFCLVAPAGNSAHLELGWATGMGIPTCVYFHDSLIRPDLMYKLADFISDSYEMTRLFLDGAIHG